jgi:hypothetical protein
MHNRLVIAFWFVAAVSCVALSMGAKADAKRYAIIMEALGKSNEIRPQQLDDLEEFLAGTGTPRAEAQEAISTALRAPFLKSTAVIDVVPLARDIGAVMGNDIVRETREFLYAFGHGIESILHYCNERNALTAEETTHLRYMDQHEQSSKAWEKALDRLQARFGGSYERLRNTNAR